MIAESKGQRKSTEVSRSQRGSTLSSQRGGARANRYNVSLCDFILFVFLCFCLLKYFFIRIYFKFYSFLFYLKRIWDVEFVPRSVTIMI